MAKRYKVIQCPHCSEYTYTPLGTHRNSCPRCKSKIALHPLKGTIVGSAYESQHHVQTRQYALHGMVAPDPSLRPAEQILQILRTFQSSTLDWLPVHEIFQRALEAGLLPKEIQEAINVLQAEGFLEKREDTIRAIPLN